ncbi:MAG TPA: TonB-dependent receptor [Xanthomonadales bacterium]|nr:TonB-dependent receptor [Xanthomonadales bacterium]
MNSTRQIKRKTLTTAITVALLTSGHASMVLAQSAAGKSGGALAMEEIMVTATRREQTVQEIPFNISALSGEALEKANVIDSVEALRYMSGISMADRGYRNAGMAERIIIRGINVDSGVDGDVPLAAVSTVATYVDGTALYGSFILKDLDRIEVLRGPQGTLYGSGSLAGNVRYIMKKPDLEEISGEAKVGFGITDGSDGYNFNPDVLVNFPISSTFAVRLNLGMINNDGIVDYPHVYALDSNGDPVVQNGDILNALPVYERVEDVDDVEIKYGRVSALWVPNDSFSAQLSYQTQDDEVGGRRQVTRGDDLVNGGQYGEYEFGAIQLEPAERDIELTSLELELGLGFATLTSSTSYYSHTGTSISDNSGVYARNGWFEFYGSSPRPIAQAERFYDDSAFSQEFRLVSDGDNFVDWTAGLYYTDQDSDLGQNSYLVGYIPYLNALNWYGIAPYTTTQDFLFRRNQNYEEIALFGEATINFTDDVHLTVGGRYFDNEVDVDALVDVPIYAVFAPPGTASESISENDFLFKTNFAWDLSDQSMLYATFSQGYRHAGANAVPTSGKYAENPEFLTFNSDSIDNYEIGFKGTTGTLDYALSAYYTDWKNPQLNTVTTNWGFFGVINGESASTRGVEVELSGMLTDSLGYSLGYTYADAELTDDVYQPAGNFYGSGVVYPDKVGADGGALPGTAEHVFNMSLRHEASISGNIDVSSVLSGYYQSETLNSIGDNVCLTEYNALGVCLDSARSTSVYYQPDSVWTRNYAEMDGFQIWNFSSTFYMDAWSASLYVKNIFNEEGTTGVFPYLRGGPNTSDSQRYYGNNSRDYLTLPRTFGVTLSYNW